MGKSLLAECGKRKGSLPLFPPNLDSVASFLLLLFLSSFQSSLAQAKPPSLFNIYPNPFHFIFSSFEIDGFGLSAFSFLSLCLRIVL